MAGLVPAINALAWGEDVDARHIRAFTPVFDGLRPGMTLAYVHDCDFRKSSTT
jgi:hypothetical protein